MTRMTKALSMAKTEAETAVIILRSSGTRPKSRMTRRARIRRTSHDGTEVFARSSTDMQTTKTSNQLCGDAFSPFSLLSVSQEGIGFQFADLI